jgi:hypothetical protein
MSSFSDVRKRRIMFGDRAIAVVAMAFVMLFLVVGCSSYKPQQNNGTGQTSAKMLSQVESLEGVASASFEYKYWYHPGEGALFSSEGMDFNLIVKVKDGFYVDKKTALLRYLFAEAWTANEKSPKGYVRVTFDGGVSKNYLWKKELADIFGAQSDTLVTGNTIQIDDSDMSDVFGDWAGSTPKTQPTGAFAVGSVPVVLPLAVNQVRLTEGDINGIYQIYITGNRNKSDSGAIYQGDVDVTVYQNGKVYQHDLALFKDAYEYGDDVPKFNVDYPKSKHRPNMSDYTYTLKLDPQAGFDTTTVKGYAS